MLQGKNWPLQSHHEGTSNDAFHVGEVALKGLLVQPGCNKATLLPGSSNRQSRMGQINKPIISLAILKLIFLP